MNNNYNEEYVKNCECAGEAMDIIKLIESLPPHTKISNLCTEMINERDSSSPRMFSFTISGVVVCDDEDDDWDDWDDDDEDTDWDDDDDDWDDDDDINDKCWSEDCMPRTVGINPDQNQPNVSYPEEIKNVKAETDESL